MPHSTAWRCLYSWASNAGGRPPGSQIHELAVTSPHYPAWGRIVIDRGGLIEWDYWGHIADDAGAADSAAVMAARPGDDARRYGRTASSPALGERDRPHP